MVRERLKKQTQTGTQSDREAEGRKQRGTEGAGHRVGRLLPRGLLPGG